MRYVLFGLAAIAGFSLAGAARADDTTAKARAADLSRYVPSEAQFFVHVNVPKVFTSELVRSAVPMAFDKYGDQLVGLMALAKQFNPNAPDVPEDQAKAAIKQMANPQAIAQAFDAAKEFVSDIVITGSMADDKPNVVVLIKSQFFTAELVEMVSNLAGQQPQMKIEKAKKEKGTVYTITVPNAEEKMYFTVPEPGVLFITSQEAGAAASFAATSKPNEKLAGLMAKRDKDDFIFATGLGNNDADYTQMAMSLQLDKNVSGKMMMVFKDEKKAAEQAKEVNDQLQEMLGQIKDFLGDKGGALKQSAEKTKAVAQGNTVTANLSIPGEALTKLLSKD
jgi:hypothetical protein